MVTEDNAQAIALLAENEGNVAQTARELDITPHMLRKLRDTNLELYQEARRRMSEALEDKVYVIANEYADEILNRVTDEEALRGMKIKELAVTMGIAIDKLKVMTTVHSRFDETQKAADGFAEMSQEKFQEAIDAEYRELSAEELKAKDESVPDTPEDEFLVKPSGVPTFGSLLPSSGNTGQA